MVLNFKFWFDYAIALFLSYSVLLPRSRYLYVFMVKVNQGIILQVLIIQLIFKIIVFKQPLCVLKVDQLAEGYVKTK